MLAADVFRVRLARVHAADNRAFDAPVEELVRALAALVDRIGAVRLVLVDEDAYVNDVRVRGASTRRSSAAPSRSWSTTATTPRRARRRPPAPSCFPPGELVELEDRRRARVAAPPERPERWAAPVVQLVGADPRSPEGPPLDLADGPAVRRALPGG